jgi:hypothetical protein
MNEYLSNVESEQDVARLAEATIGLLQGGIEDETLAEVESMPPSVVQREITAAAESLGVSAEAALQLADATSQENLATGITRTVVAELSRDESLGREIADSYERRAELMVVDPLTISAAALLLLVLRVRRVRLSKKEGLDVSLEPLKGNVVKAVLSFVGGAH